MLKNTSQNFQGFFSCVLSVFLLCLFQTHAHAQSIPTTLGWHQYTGTSWRSVCDPAPQVGNDCSNVVTAWSGGAFDTLRNRLYWWGGGHSDYFGNEMYAWDVDNPTARPVRLYNSSTSPDLRGYSGAIGQMADGKISARHNYNHNVYIPTLDKVYTFGGATPVTGSFGTDTWFFDPATLQWSRQNVSGTVPLNDFGMNAQWNPNDNRIYIMDSNNLYRFDPAASNKSYSVIASKSFCAYRSGFLDTKRNYYWVIINSACGTPQVWKISLTGSGNSWQQVTATGATSILAPNWLGIEYDPVSDRAVIWDTGNTVYTMDPSNGAIAANSLGSTAGPSKASSRGTMGRWRYVPSLGIFVVANGPDTNMYTFRLTPSGSTTPPPGDAVPPAAPTGLSATSASANQINLFWNTSTDNVGIAGYHIFRSGSQIGTSATTSYSNTGLSPSTTYTYTVVAYDTSGNISSHSASATATTQAGTAPTGSQTLTFSIVSASDDVHQNGSEFQSGGPEMFFGFWNGNDETSGLRFPQITIPKGATISSAILTVRAVADDDSNTTLAKVRGIASDNAPSFTSTNRPSQGPFTAASIDWNSGPWSVGSSQSSPNVASVIREITSRSNWQSGNALSLVISNNGTTVNADRGFSQFEGGFPATLTVTFAAGGTTPSDTTPPSVSISAPISGATVSGTVTVAATASDNIDVASVQFKLNGSNLGTEDTTNSFSQTWDTTTVANGTYLLAAVATDVSGNQTTSENVMITVNNTSSSSPSAGVDTDFQARCSAPGVVKCVGFDNASDFTVPAYPDDGPYPPGGSGPLTRLTRDTSTKASGTGSARFQVVGNTGGENPSGSWVVSFPTVREGQKLYIQFRQRFDTNMINNKSSFGGGGWKQIIIHSLEAGSCALLEITMNNQSYRGFPNMYSDCGGQTFTFFSSQANDVVMEWSKPYPPGSPGTVGTDYWCLYNLHLKGDTSNRCAFYQPNQWMTFYYEIEVGNWGQANSKVRAWVGYEEQPLKMVINHIAYRINKEGIAPGLNRLTLTNYDTGRCIISSCSHPTAHTWYDELIVSTLPIAAPGNTAQPTTPPAAPTNLTLQ